MNYYRSTITGKIVSDSFVSQLSDIYGDDLLNQYIVNKILVPIDSPDIIDCIRYDSIKVAVLRYMELHQGYSWEEAYKQVKRIKRDMIRNRNKTREKEQDNGNE